MTTPTTTGKGEVIVRRALTQTLRERPGTIEFHPTASTSELARLAQRGHATVKDQSPDVVRAVTLDALRYANSVGLRGVAHTYDQYRYAVLPDQLAKTCTINFYFWTEETKGGAS